MQRSRLWVTLICFALLTATPATAQHPPPASPVPATDPAPAVKAGGAPQAGGGSIHITGFVRVLEGDTFMTWATGQQMVVGIAGITAPPGNTPCGRAAMTELRTLVRGGVRLEEDPALTFDERNRRMYRAFTLDGRSIAQELVRLGAVRADGRSGAAPELVAAQAAAQAARRGCLWSGQQPNGEARALVPAPAPAATAPAVQPAGAVQPAATTLPVGFSQEVVAAGLVDPTAFAFLPDGRILIAEKAGRVRVVKNSVLLSTPMLDIRDRVNDYGDRGLIGLAVPPDFASSPSIYLLYTYENNSGQYSGPKTGRLARYAVSGDLALLRTESVILGRYTGNSCTDFPAGTDCIPSDGLSHSVGSVRFAPDGTLFVTLGDAADFNVVDDYALRAQDLDWMAGKVLRITTSGQGMPSNPFWNGDPNAIRSKVWAYGLRNAYRFNLRPDTGRIYLGDVGWHLWEKISVVPAGANLGWPCYEGSHQQSGYAPKAVCQGLYAQGPAAVQFPLVEWDHTAAGALGSAATGGTFYTGTTYPAEYRGAYFYADYGQNWIRFLRVDANDALIPGSVTTFATGADGPVDLAVGPDGDLYYLSINTGQLRRIRYTAGNTPPTAVASATPTSGSGRLIVQFSSAGSHDPDGDPLSYTWDFGDGSAPSTAANPSHMYTANGVFTARLTVSDGRGGSDSAVVTITVGSGVGNRAPTATISAPASSFRFKVGDVVTYAGSATDPEDGPLPASALSWTVVLLHCPGFGTACHSHPFLSSTGAGGSFTVPDHGDGVRFQITLTARDAQGLTGTSTVTIDPQTVQITLATSPPGLQVVYNGESGAAPLTRTAVVGAVVTIFTPSPQGAMTFKSWSDGKAQQHNITVGTSNATYTATFEGPELLIGDQSVATALDSTPAGQAQAFQYTATGSGTVTGFSVYLDASNSATRVVVGLYTSTAGGNPGALLTQATISSPVNGAWNAVSAPAAVVTAGTQYWIAVLSPAGSGTLRFRDTARGGPSQTSLQTDLGALPATWTAGARFASAPMSAFAFGSTDSQPPVVSLTAPSAGAVVSGTAVTVSAVASDNVGVTSVQFLLNGAPLGAPVTAAPYTITWNTTTVANGSHTLSARASDGAGNVALAAAITVTVANVDTSPPIISGVAVSGITPTSATITWTTNEPATSQVRYGQRTASDVSTPLDPTLVTAHGQTLTGLQPGTVYRFVVISRDAAGNEAISPEFTLTTAPVDTRPPVISGVSVSSVTATTVTITWTTDEPATSQVLYGGPRSYRSSTTLDTTLTRTHSQTITGLHRAPCTTSLWSVVTPLAMRRDRPSSLLLLPGLLAMIWTAPPIAGERRGHRPRNSAYLRVSSTHQTEAVALGEQQGEKGA